MKDESGRDHISVKYLVCYKVNINACNYFKTIFVSQFFKTFKDFG